MVPTPTFASSKLGRPHHFLNPTLAPTQIVVSSPNVQASRARANFVYIYTYNFKMLLFGDLETCDLTSITSFCTIASYCTRECMGFVKKIPCMCDLLLLLSLEKYCFESQHVNKNFSQKIEQWSNPHETSLENTRCIAHKSFGWGLQLSIQWT